MFRTIFVTLDFEALLSEKKNNTATSKTTATKLYGCPIFFAARIFKNTG